MQLPHPGSNDLLTAPVLTIAEPEGNTGIALPALFARMLAGPEVLHFPNVTAEQHGYVWRFFVRCAAKALHELGLGVEGAVERNDLETAIHEVLRDAAPEGAWLLHQADPVKPGFLQPPTPDGLPPEQSRYSANPPSILTGTLGVKDHERKYDVVRDASAEQVFFALIEYQFGAIFGGRGNYASQLMGSAVGMGSGTPFMGAQINGSVVETFRHDVRVLLARWERIRGEHGLQGKVWALWAERWDGKTPLQSSQLDPAFIPTARLVRLGAPEESRFRTVWFRATDAARVRDLIGGGNLGDTFAPLVEDPKDRTAWKVRGTLAKGYDYAEVVRLLFGDDKYAARPSPAVAALQNLDEDERGDLEVLFQGVAYEQGKTQGFHRRTLLLPAHTVGYLADPDPVRATHRQMLDRVVEVKRALRSASRLYMTGTPRGRTGDERRAELAGDRFERALDAEASLENSYPAHLFRFTARRQADDDGWTWEWGAHLRVLARTAFEEALPLLPQTTSRHFERESAAWSYLEFRLALVADPEFAEERRDDSPPEPEET